MIGISFLFVPVGTLSYTGTTEAQGNDVSGMTNLARNVGGSCRTAFVTTMLARKQQIHQVYLTSHAKNSNPFYLGKMQQSAACTPITLPKSRSPAESAMTSIASLIS